LTPPFETSDGFLADPPVQPDGVNPGEWVSITFDLLPSTSFSDVLAYLSSTALRIGIHVQGFESGGSESYVNVPYNPPCTDNDGDGYGNPESPNCPNPGLDCDDSNPNVNPGAMEEPYDSGVCSDGLDNDCDGLVDIDDPGCWQCTTSGQCNDGNPCTDDACVASRCVYTNNTNPCDDGDPCTMNDVCSEGICSGVWKDTDGDGYVDVNCGGKDCNDQDPSVNPKVFEAPPEGPACTDGIDNNCNGYTDLEDAGCVPSACSPVPAADAAVYGGPSQEGPSVSKLFFALLLPIGAVFFVRRVLGRK
jgi:Putative metal-binding motif